MELNDAFLVALLDDDEINLNVIGNAVEAIVEPLITIPPRNESHRNQSYYEIVIPNYNLDDFFDHFRMTRGIFDLLLNKLRYGLPNEDYGVIAYEKKLLFTIWKLAKQESFLSAGDRFNLAKSTGHKIFFEVIQHIADLREQIIKWPNRHQRLEISRRFEERSGIPGIVGAINGRHISIKGPPGNAVDCYNRNNYISIILQATCNDKKEFIDIYVGAPGRLHDARVFRMSPLFELLSGDNPPILQNEHLLGDAAYPLTSYLLKPYLYNGHLTEEQLRFNTRMSSSRSTIALLKGKFRRPKYLEMSKMDVVPTVVTAACVLHNFILFKGHEINNYENDNIQEENNEIEIPQRADNVGETKRDYTGCSGGFGWREIRI